jgi:pantoate--beta-alanine ligase
LQRWQGSVGLVPTMGALHAGHQANIDAARSGCDGVVVSLFVNPLQFNQAADLDRYPRTLEADLALCEQARVDLVWAPTVPDLYPNGTVRVRITGGELADQLEGTYRPGHFDGVLTVVAKLFAAVRPDVAFFGEKDYQQLVLIQAMVADLDFGVRVVGVPTVRDPDGLALSSRNIFLTDEQRRSAVLLPDALAAGRARAGGADEVLAAARAVLTGAAVDSGRGGPAAPDSIKLDYLALRSPALTDAPVSGPARLLAAVRVGSVRLIDNTAVELTP